MKMNSTLAAAVRWLPIVLVAALPLWGQVRPSKVVTKVPLPTVAGAGTVADIDGNQYKTIIYGKLEWMVENLRTTRLHDGTPIPSGVDDAVWSNVDGPAMAWFGNERSSVAPAYGALYNWHAVGTGKLAPAGWRVPTQEEWNEFLTGTMGGKSVTGGQVFSMGKLKSKRADPDAHPRWDAPNVEASDETGFGTLPGGSRNFVGAFDYLGKYGFWWTATTASPSYLAWYRGMRYDNGAVFATSGNKQNGFSVRCVREIK